MNTKEIPVKVLELQKRIELLESIAGVHGPWLTPAEAAKVLPIGMDRIKSEIHTAEQKRAARQPHDLIYGTHYYNAADTGDKNSWRVCLSEFWAVVQKPFNERL